MFSPDFLLRATFVPAAAERKVFRQTFLQKGRCPAPPRPHCHRAAPRPAASWLFYGPLSFGTHARPFSLQPLPPQRSGRFFARPFCKKAAVLRRSPCQAYTGHCRSAARLRPALPRRNTSFPHSIAARPPPERAGRRTRGFCVPLFPTGAPADRRQPPLLSTPQKRNQNRKTEERPDGETQR